MLDLTVDTLRRNAVEERDSERVPCVGQVTYRYASDEEGRANLRSVGSEGACISLGRYLRPGRHIILAADGAHHGGDPIELSGRVVWCRPSSRGQRFVAGIRVFDDDPRSTFALSVMAGSGCTERVAV